MKPFRLVYVLPLALTLLTPEVATSHGGGLNSDGCHNNRKTGGYHCHRSSYRRPSRSSYRSSSSSSSSGSRSRSRAPRKKKMSLTVIPRAEVYYQGKRLGVSPVKNIKVPAASASVTFELVHPILGKHSIKVDPDSAKGSNVHVTW